MFKALKEGLSAKAKAVIIVVLLVILAGGSFGAYKVWDYKENNPSFCVGCHLMQDAFDKWAVSGHKGVNCHECHHLTLVEQNMLLVNLVLHNPKEVPARHGKVIVPWKYCTKCHIETDEKHPDAVKINNSPFHARHFFMGQVECTKCHGYKLHEFKPEPRYCINCHKDKEHVHGMPDLVCMSCHTDKTTDFKPNRAVCLSCHGSAAQREQVLKDVASGPLKQLPPSMEQISIASKMTVFPEDGAMKFECSRCHKPHGKLFLQAEGDCLPCHRNIKATGKHQTHLDMGLKCLDCHRPHGWKVTREMGRSAKCTKCHGPVDPAKFLN